MLRIPADVNELAGIRQFVREHAVRAGADPEQTDDLVQAVDESATNSIIHGYRGAEGWVEVAIDVLDHSLVVRVRDEAPAFDPTVLPDPDVTLPLEQRPLHGLGVFLARELADDVTYRQTDKGNELTLTKTIDRRGR